MGRRPPADSRRARRRIASPIGEGALGAGEGDGVEAGPGAGDDRAVADADAVLCKEIDLLARERIVAEGRDIGRRPVGAQRMQGPQRVEGVAGKAHAPVRSRLTRQFEHTFAN